MSELEVDLEPHSSGIGLTIKGGTDFNLPIIIAELIPNQPAEKSGLLKIGDIILAINDVPLVNVTHSEAIRIILRTISKNKVTFLLPGSELSNNEHSSSAGMTTELPGKIRLKILRQNNFFLEALSSELKTSRTKEETNLSLRRQLNNWSPMFSQRYQKEKMTIRKAPLSVQPTRKSFNKNVDLDEDYFDMLTAKTEDGKGKLSGPYSPLLKVRKRFQNKENQRPSYDLSPINGKEEVPTSSGNSSNSEVRESCSDISSNRSVNFEDFYKTKDLIRATTLQVHEIPNLSDLKFAQLFASPFNNNEAYFLPFKSHSTLTSDHKEDSEDSSSYSYSLYKPSSEQIPFEKWFKDFQLCLHVANENAISELNLKFGPKDKIIFAGWFPLLPSITPLKAKNISSNMDLKNATSLMKQMPQMVFVVVRKNRLQIFARPPKDLLEWSASPLESLIHQTAFNTRVDGFYTTFSIHLPNMKVNLFKDDKVNYNNFETAWLNACSTYIGEIKIQSFLCQYGRNEGIFSIDLDYGFRLIDSSCGNLLWQFKFSQLNSSCDDNEYKMWLQFVEPLSKEQSIERLPENMTMLITPNATRQYTQILFFRDLGEAVLSIHSFLLIRLRKMSHQNQSNQFTNQ